MKFTDLIIFLETVGCVLGLRAEGVKTPQWVYKIRVVSIPHHSERYPWNQVRFRKQLQLLKASGVNTIMDHGSLQFMPGIPDSYDYDQREQWKRKLHYESALPYSKIVKETGLRLFHHTTSTFVPQEAVVDSRYMSWISRDIRTGKYALRVPGTAYGDAYFMDMNHPEFREAIFTRMAEYARKTGADGWMTDEVEWLPDIYAGGTEEGSRAKFRKLYGQDYPEGKLNLDIQNWRRYVAFRYHSGGDFFRDLLERLRRVNPHMQLTSCITGPSKSWRRGFAMGNSSWLAGLNMGFYEMEEASSPQKKSGGFLSTTFWPSYYREMALYNAYKEINGWGTVLALGYPRSWKKKNSEQFYLWALTSAMGFRYWMRDYQAEPEFFKWEARHEKDLVNSRAVCNIGVFFPEYSRDYTNSNADIVHNWSGFSEALAWKNIPADQIVRDYFKKPELLRRFKLIILPSCRFISADMTRELKKFVQKGGVLIVSGQAEQQDPFADPPEDNEFRKILGVEKYGKMIPGKVGFSITGGNSILPPGDYEYPDGMIQAQPVSGASVLASVPGRGPAVIENRIGSGRVIWFTGSWGLTMNDRSQQKASVYQREYDPEQRELLAQLVSRLMDRKLLVEVENMPAKVLLQIRDTDGDFDGIFQRTVHLLDSFDGCENGESFAARSQPCRFQNFAVRNQQKPLIFTVRGIKKISEARMITPDRSKDWPLKPVWNTKMCGWRFAIPAKVFGRYSVIVLKY